MSTIRPERPDDMEQVRSVLSLAFKRKAEAKLAERMRRAGIDLLSLVAEENGKIVGHVMFSPVLIENAKSLWGMGLAPMAVLPQRQRRSIGSQLVAGGLEILRQRNCPFVVVLGHPGYYPRFGFEPASRLHIRSQWQGVPDEAFMILVLDDAAMQNVSGTAAFRKEFNESF